MLRAPAGYIPLTMHELQGGSEYHRPSNSRDAEGSRSHLPSREKRGRRSHYEGEERGPRERGERRPRKRPDRERLSFSKPRDEEKVETDEIVLTD